NGKGIKLTTMTNYQLRVERRAQEALKKTDKHQVGIIMAWIKKNLVETTNPRKHGKSLSANRAGEWRYRIGDYRIIALINDEKVTILVLEIGHRREIYK